MFSKLGKSTLIAFAMAGLVIGCAKSNNLAKGKQATKTVPKKQPNVTTNTPPSNPNGTTPAPNTTTNPTPGTTPVDALYSSVAAGQSLTQALEQQPANYSTALCAQVVTTNGQNMLWVSAGACPADGSLQNWNSVWATFMYNNPDSNGNMVVWDPENWTVDLGYLTQDTTQPVASSFTLQDFCTGDYAMSSDGTSGCSLVFSGSSVTGIFEGTGTGD